MIRTGQISECQAVDGGILAMAMKMTMARVRSTRRAVRMCLGKAWEEKVRRGEGR